MATIKFISVPSKRLAASINATASSFQLDNIKGWDGNDLVAGDFGSVAYAVFRNDASTLMELIEIDPSTIASSSITINKKGLQFDGNLTTEVSANKLTWVKNETIVELGSNPPQLLNHMVRIIEDQIIAGIKTFSSLPAITAGDPVADNDVARKAYVDGVVAGTFPANRIVVAGTAGETIADGNLIYFDTITNNEWMKCDADTAATIENVQLGIAQGAGTNGVAITGGVLLKGEDDAQSGMTPGDLMYASNTAGAIASSAGTKEVTVGIARTTTVLYFSPRLNQMLTEDEQDALAGNLGTPASGDKYVTQTGLQKGAEVYAADAEASDTYVITLSPVPASLYTGMVIHFKANTANTGAATLNVNTLGAITIKKNNDQDLVTGDIEASQIITVVYDGTNFQMQSQLAQIASVDIQTFTSSDTYTKPAGAKKAFVQVWGAGGGGGGTAATANTNSGAGGGGAYLEGWFDEGDLGATETVTIGSVGAGGASGDNDGAAGGNTTFGSLLTGYGGGGGAGATSGDSGAGGGGGALSVGGSTTDATVGLGGEPGTGVGDNSGFGGGDGESNKAAYGGAGGAEGVNNSANPGGDSVYGGGGGGAGDGGTGGTSVFGGAGGAAGNNSDGSNGIQPGGGGGGVGDGGASSAHAGGDGAAGKVIVTTFL